MALPIGIRYYIDEDAQLLPMRTLPVPDEDAQLLPMDSSQRAAKLVSHYQAWEYLKDCQVWQDLEAQVVQTIGSAIVDERMQTCLPEDVFHIPQELQKFLPKVIAVNPVLDVISECAVGEKEQARRQAQERARLHTTFAIGKVHAALDLIQHCRFTNADVHNDLTEKLQIVLSMLHIDMSSPQVRKAGAAVAAAAQVQVQQVVHTFLQYQPQASTTASEKDAEAYLLYLNKCMLDITMVRCQAVCHDPRDLLNQAADAYKGGDMEKHGILQMLLTYLINDNLDDPRWRSYDPEEALVVRQRSWAFEKMQGVMDAALLPEDALVAMTDAAVAVSLTTTTITMTNKSLTTAVRVQVLVDEVAHICPQAAIKSMKALRRCVRDMVMMALRDQCCDPKNRDEFLARAAEAYAVPELDQTFRAQLLLSYHKDRKNQRLGFQSTGAIQTHRRGGPRPRRGHQ